jgi:hypothetical protein
MKCKVCGSNIEVTQFDDGSEIVRQDCSCKDPFNLGPGCYGRIPGYFISRSQLPKICGDNLCISAGPCFIESFKNQTGIKDPGVLSRVSYKTFTPKWRSRSE